MMVTTKKTTKKTESSKRKATKRSKAIRIHTYIGCARCIAELPSNESPESYARFSVGFVTFEDGKPGIQVRCVRHAIPVATIALDTGDKFAEDFTKRKCCKCNGKCKRSG